MEWECGECGEWVEPADADQDTCEECGAVKGQGSDDVREACSSASIACRCGGVKITFASDAPALAAECSCVDCRHRFNTFAARGGPTMPADVVNQDACLLMYYFQVCVEVCVEGRGSRRRGERHVGRGEVHIQQKGVCRREGGRGEVHIQHHEN
jgi:hypothetical protein